MATEIDNFDRLMLIIEDRPILLTDEYKSFSDGKDKIFINGIFLEISDKRPNFGRSFPRREFFERSHKIPLLASGFTKDLIEGGSKVHAAFIYDTDLTIYLNESKLSSRALEKFLVAQEPINTSSDALEFVRAVHEIGHNG